MEAELKEQIPSGCTVELIRGGKGIFDVKVGDTLIFSKYEVSRFPEPNEVIRLLSEHGYI